MKIMLFFQAHPNINDLAKYEQACENIAQAMLFCESGDHQPKLWQKVLRDKFRQLQAVIWKKNDVDEFVDKFKRDNERKKKKKKNKKKMSNKKLQAYFVNVQF